jgi:hypothetical protein
MNKTREDILRMHFAGLIFARCGGSTPQKSCLYAVGVGSVLRSMILSIMP